MNVNESNNNNNNDKTGRCSLLVVGSPAKEYNGHLRVDYADKTKSHHLKQTFFSLPQIRTARPQPAYETHGRVEQDLQAESTSFTHQKNETHTHTQKKQTG